MRFRDKQNVGDDLAFPFEHPLLSQHHAKFNGHKSYEKLNIVFLIRHVASNWSCIQ